MQIVEDETTMARVVVAEWSLIDVPPSQLCNDVLQELIDRGRLSNTLIPSQRKHGLVNIPSSHWTHRASARLETPVWQG